MMIDSAGIGLLLRLKRDASDTQRISFVGSIPILVEKSVTDKILDRIIRFFRR